jgi:3-oxoacyl-[acyl-carrier-protein] synthase-3
LLDLFFFEGQSVIGIKAIATYLPAGRVSNFDRKEAFDVTDEFIEDKIGIRRVAVRGEAEGTTALALRAFDALVEGYALDPQAIQVVVVVTQNPDRNIPHTSAEIHGQRGLAETCACFDISLGCSGYVYALSLVSAFMQANSLSTGVLVTADPYSKIIDPADKNTSLLFGDAAAATLLTADPVLAPGRFTFGTAGREADQLACNDGRLFMNGRAVFNFAAKYVPTDVTQVLRLNGLDIATVDAFLFHQGSKYIVDTIANRLKIPRDKARFGAGDYGNAVSSSIPLLLAEEMKRPESRTILVSGFGLGFSWASTILKRL